MRSLVTSILLSAAFAVTPHAQQWPSWRGPSSSGLSVERGLLVE